MSSLLTLTQSIAVTPPVNIKPVLALSELFTLFFITMGPPLKTPAIYFARTHHLDHATRRSLAVKTFVLATIAVLIGGLLGMLLRANWHISIAAMTLAGGIIFFVVSLRTVLDQYEPAPLPMAPAPSQPAPPPPEPDAFAMAIPMIITPYGLGAVIITLSNSNSTGRTIAIFGLVLGVMVLHLLAMLFAEPIMRKIGPLPFKLLGTIIGSLTVALSIQMIMVALFELGLLQAPSLLS